MASDVSICSAALCLLGDSPIASLSEPNSAAARLCANIYPQAKEDILRVHPWNCLQARIVLSPEVATPAFEWAYAFVPPSDMLRVIAVGYDGCPEDYLLEGGRILARSNVLRLRYLQKKAEAFWDTLLVQVMTKRMQMDLCYPITKSTSLRDTLKEDFYRRGTGVLAQAKVVDGQENPPEDWEQSAFIAVRG